MTSLLQTHMDAFLLAVASSTDNFMVGITAGLASPSLLHFYKVNLAVAVCNSCGTLLATYGGGSLKQIPERALLWLAATVSSSSSPETYQLNVSIESLLAALAFCYLAWKEYRQEDDSHDKKKPKLSYSIALPMTLNNLAGGVAGGVLGLSVFQATFYAFLVSFGSMGLGHLIASRMVQFHQNKTKSNSSHQSQEKTNATTNKWCKHFAIFIYLLLSLQSFLEV